MQKSLEELRKERDSLNKEIEERENNINNQHKAALEVFYKAERESIKEKGISGEALIDALKKAILYMPEYIELQKKNAELQKELKEESFKNSITCTTTWPSDTRVPKLPKNPYEPFISWNFS